MRRRSYELWCALGTMVVVAAIYAAVVRRWESIPAAKVPPKIPAVLKFESFRGELESRRSLTE